MTNSEYQQLVEFLGRQFAEIDRRFTAVDQGFVAVDQRFTAMEQRFETRFETIEEHLRDVLRPFAELEQRVRG